MTVPVESFVLPSESEGTLQHRIKRQVVGGILAGRFQRGERLPSTRALARHLGISRITVAFAYSDLVADDFLVPRGRSGFYVSDTAPTTPEVAAPGTSAEGSVDWRRHLRRPAPQTVPVNRPKDWQRYPYPFIYGQPDPTLFDHSNWRQCGLQALGQREFNSLTADHYERDDPKLVDYLLRQILPRRGISAGPENVLLTLGSQNALWVAADLLLSARRTAVIENPGYTGLRDILVRVGCRMVALDVDGEGLPPDALPEDTDVVFVTATHHCPTGVTMPLARRQLLLGRAAEGGFLIVEDDYEIDMATPGPATPALKAHDRDGRVIYLGSFSKSLFPGLRLGYIVAPSTFIQHARALRATVLRHPPGMVQRTAAYFLALGHYDAQINRMRKIYAARRAEMDAAIAAYGLTSAHDSRRGGAAYWMRAPEGVDTGLLALRLRAKGVIIEPGAAFFDPETPDRQHYRMAFSSIPASRIRSGIGLLAEEIAEMQEAL